MSLADHFYRRLAFDACRTYVPNFRKCLIVKSDALAGIDHGDTLHHAAQNCARAIAFLGERANRGVQPSGCLIEDARQIAKLVIAALLRQGAKIAVRDAPRKLLKACHTIRKTAREQKRQCDAQQQNKKGYLQEIPAHLRQGRVDFSERRRETNNDGRPWGTIEAHGPINKVTVKCMAVAHRFTFTSGHGLAEFWAIRMVFHGFNIVSRIGEDPAIRGNYRDARSAARQPRSPRRKGCGILKRGRAVLHKLRERSKVLARGANVVLTENASRIEIDARHYGEQEHQIGESEFPKEAGSGGLQII